MKYCDRIPSENRVTILALSWRDIKAPASGGAEVHTHQMLSRLDKDKYCVVHFSPMFKDGKNEEIIDGINYIRKGNIFSVIRYARKFYKKNQNNIDFVIDQCNTHRFFTPFWVESHKRIFYIHQLTREIWRIMLKFPFSIMGERLETPLLKLNKNDWTVTVSNSTKEDLMNVGFNEKKIVIIPNGVSFTPWKSEEFCEKQEATFVYVGRYASYKGIDVAVEAFGKIKNLNNNAKLWILGKRDNNYIQNILVPICDKYNLKIGNEDDDSDIVCWGFVSEEEKKVLLSKSVALLFPSQREGWGIPITEAGNVGTPSIVFDSAGIRDAVDFGRAGYICSSNDANGLIRQMERVIVDKSEYEMKRNAAYEFSKQFQWSKTGYLFEEFIENLKGKKGE